MRVAGLIAFLGVFGFSAADRAEACMGIIEDTVDSLMETGPNGEFSNGGPADWFGSAQADQGNGIVVQRVLKHEHCGYVDVRYVAVDCESGRARVFFYNRSSFHYLRRASMDAKVWQAEVFLLPDGHPGAIPSGSDLEEMIVEGRRMGYQSIAFERSDLAPRRSAMEPPFFDEPWFDLYAGCLTYYPDSAKAQG
ncbi:MAG: hypothetical protein ACRCS3_10405 [Paracoccaceae bacterium]